MKLARAAVFAAPLSLAALFAASSARADDESGVLDSRHRRYESPQNFAMELRFALYNPNVDSAPELGGKTPFADAFGTSPRVEIAGEFDWQVLRIPHVGTIGPGVSLGYVTMGRPAQIANCPPLPRGATSCTSGESQTLEIYPMYGVVVFRADVFLRDWRIPLVPYVKGGIGFAFWRASNSLGTSSAPDGTGNTISGKGHTWGTQAAAGLALDLNTFDTAAAVNLDNAVGINHTYAFFEVMNSQLTGLFQSHALYVGTTSWAAGLAFEM